MLSTKRIPMILISLTVWFAGMAAPRPANAVPGYFVRGTGGIGLREHVAPRVDSSVARVLAENTSLDIICQTQGDAVHGSSIWDKLADGGYVSDWYTSTPVVGGFSPGLPQCESASPVAAAQTYHVAGTGYYGTLNVRSGPARSYPVVGKLREGDTASVACQTSGGSVQGSSIWDRLSQGGYVSDAYLTTPRFNAYSPGLAQCDDAPPAPEPTSAVQAEALKRASNLLGSTDYLGLCDRFVAVAYGRSHSGYATAAAHMQALEAQGLMHYGSADAPAGALVFYYAGPANGWAGHVALSTGDGRAISSEHWVGRQRQGVGYITIGTSRNFGSYAGWAMPPSSWTG